MYYFLFRIETLVNFLFYSIIIYCITMAVSRKRMQKIMTQPINQIFRFFTNRTWVQIWICNKPNMRIEGLILGFDEYMNLVLGNAEEVSIKNNQRQKIGKILLKGDTITLIREVKNVRTKKIPDILLS